MQVTAVSANPTVEYKNQAGGAEPFSEDTTVLSQQSNTRTVLSVRVFGSPLRPISGWPSPPVHELDLSFTAVGGIQEEALVNGEWQPFGQASASVQANAFGTVHAPNGGPILKQGSDGGDEDDNSIYNGKSLAVKLTSSFGSSCGGTATVTYDGASVDARLTYSIGAV